MTFLIKTQHFSFADLFLDFNQSSKRISPLSLAGRVAQQEEQLLIWPALASVLKNIKVIVIHTHAHTHTHRHTDTHTYTHRRTCRRKANGRSVAAASATSSFCTSVKRARLFSASDASMVWMGSSC